MKILSEISAGELLDKITILEIKIDKIKNEDDKKEVLKEAEEILDVEGIISSILLVDDLRIQKN